MTYNAIEDALRLPTLLDLFNVDETSVSVLRRVDQLVEFDDGVTRQHAMLELPPVTYLLHTNITTCKQSRAKR